jgi:hypothetical protein
MDQMRGFQQEVLVYPFDVRHFMGSGLNSGITTQRLEKQI